MGVKEMAKVSFNDQWLMVDSRGDLRLFKKDSVITRWLKFLIQILCLGCTAPYDHIRIDRVALAILRHSRLEKDPKKHQYYLRLVEHLLNAQEPIRAHRAALKALYETLRKEKPDVTN